MPRRLAAGLLLVATCCTGRQTPPPSTASAGAHAGRPPRVIASDLFLCPADFPFAAYGRFFYLPNDPDRPGPSVRPSRCFARSAEARFAGLRLAPGPPGSETLGDVSLEPITPSAEPACRRAARTLRMTILCPTIAPVSFGSITDCRRPDCVELDAFVLQDSFSGPPGYVGIPNTNGNHLFLFESKAGRERQLLFLTCDAAKLAGSTTVRGRPGTWIVCPTGSSMNSGHVMLVWTEGNARYAISLHADTPLNRSIATVVAANLVEVVG